MQPSPIPSSSNGAAVVWPATIKDTIENWGVIGTPSVGLMIVGDRVERGFTITTIVIAVSEDGTEVLTKSGARYKLGRFAPLEAFAKAKVAFG